MTDGIEYVDMTVNSLVNLRIKGDEIPPYIRLTHIVASGVVHGGETNPVFNFNYSCFLRDVDAGSTEGPFLLAKGSASARKATAITHSAEKDDHITRVEGELKTGEHDHFYLSIDNITLEGLIE